MFPKCFLFFTKSLCRSLNSIFKKGHVGRYEKVSLTSTEKKSVINIDHQPSWRFLGRHRLSWCFQLVDVNQTELFYWSTSTIQTFSWSTSTRLRFSTGRCRPVENDQTELFYWSTSWSTVDARRRCQHCWRPFYWRFHHALLKFRFWKV